MRSGGEEAYSVEGGSGVRRRPRIRWNPARMMGAGWRTAGRNGRSAARAPLLLTVLLCSSYTIGLFPVVIIRFLCLSFARLTACLAWSHLLYGVVFNSSLSRRGIECYSLVHSPVMIYSVPCIVLHPAISGGSFFIVTTAASGEPDSLKKGK